MKRDIAALIRLICPNLPEVRIKSSMVVFPPFRKILKGLYFEHSGSDKYRFYIWVFFVPLCVPAQNVMFDLGRRIGGIDQRWDFRDSQLVEKISSCIQSDALPFLRSVQNAQEAARVARSMAGTTRSPHIRQAIAYLLAQSGEANEASRLLDELLSLLKLDVPWQAEMAADAQRLRTLLSESPKDAEAQLDAWEAGSIHNLGLEEIGF